MQLSVIIPTLNEEDVLESTLKKVIAHSSGLIKEIIIADGGSSDSTRLAGADNEFVQVVPSPGKGRAVQMNAGAAVAKAQVLFFLHADTIPPPCFDKKIIQALKQENSAGCFRLSFDQDYSLLRFYGWCTKFDVDAFRFGDQGLFIAHHVFKEIGGFREDHLVMEDNEIVTRIKKNYLFKIMPDSVITSARKYVKNGVIRLELIFMLIYSCYHLGCRQETLKKIYDKLIK